MKAKKGISLIVLVITIIVIIILAGAVIFNLSNNNPIDNAKVAKVAQDVDSVESAMTMHISSVTVKTDANYSVSDILLGKAVETPAIDATPATFYKGVTAISSVEEDIDGFKLHKLTNAKAALNIEPNAVTGGTWYVDVDSAKVYLVFDADTDIPSWLGGADYTANATAAKFVLVNSGT